MNDPKPSDTVAEVLRLWTDLGGTLEKDKKGDAGTTYIKLLHRDFDTSKACLVVNLKRSGEFDYFAHVRVKDKEEWDNIYREVADGFEPYMPDERGVTSNARKSRVESKPRGNANLRRFLEITRDHWVKRGC